MLGVVGRTDVFVDGFNLYHGISDSRVGGNPRNKWLDESAKNRPAQIQKCRFPDVVTAVDGQEFACPPEW